jgi:Gpi18-like mannosyltransferase
LLAALGLPALIALSLVAFLSSLLLIVALYAWARVDCGPDGAWHTVFLFITSPFAFVLVLPYSEPLFLLMTGLFFIFLRKRQWIRAGLAGAMATLTRQQGLFFAVPLVISLAGDAEWKLRRIVDNWHDWISVAFIPLAYTGWIAYRAFALKDLQPDFSSLREFVYSVLISPNAVRVVPVQTFTWPWRAMALAVRKVLNAPDGDIWLNLIFAGLFLILTRMAWQKLQLASKVYTVLIVLLSFSYSTGPVHPYMGLVRHLLLALPVFIGLGKSVTSTPKRMILIASGVVGQMVLVMAFVLHIWVP